LQKVPLKINTGEGAVRKGDLKSPSFRIFRGELEPSRVEGKNF